MIRMSVVLTTVFHLVLAGGAAAGGAQPPAVSAAPCSTAEHRQLDFWLGSWEVRDPAGALVGLSQVDAVLDGCVVQERWRGQGTGAGFDGMSLNTYDSATRTWHQHWVDNTGRSTELVGGVRDGRMVLQGGVRHGPNGPQVTRITWEPVDHHRVRQHVERSLDDGRTWSTVFDGRYSRRAG
jgi:hypothetical protein